jgi:hypothetical protein
VFASRGSSEPLDRPTTRGVYGEAMRSFLSIPSFFFMSGAVMATKLHRGAARKGWEQ